MTAFQIYAAFGAPLVLLIVCLSMALATRAKIARRLWGSKADRGKPPLESEIADMQARITRMEAKVERLRDAVGQRGDDAFLQPAAQ